MQKTDNPTNVLWRKFLGLGEIFWKNTYFFTIDVFFIDFLPKIALTETVSPEYHIVHESFSQNIALTKTVSPEYYIVVLKLSPSKFFSSQITIQIQIQTDKFSPEYHIGLNDSVRHCS